LSRALLAIVSALSITSVHALGARPSAVHVLGARSSGLSIPAVCPSLRGLGSRAGVALRGRATLRMADIPMSSEPRVFELLGRAQRATLREIQRELGLEAGDTRTHSLADKVDGSVQAFVGGRVAWASALHVPLTGCDYSANWLTVWNGPLIGVPHYQLRMDVIEGHIELLVNFSPRGDAAYNTLLDDGSYPEFDSREKFAQAQRRDENAEQFFTPAACAWRDALLATPGIELRESSLLPDQAISPLLVEARLPLEQVDAVVAACKGATAAWLEWMRGADEFAQVKSMLAFAYDCKVRPGVHAQSLKALGARFGDAGRGLAMDDAGPLDLKDRGSAMNEAAGDNWKEAAESTKYRAVVRYDDDR